MAPGILIPQIEHNLVWYQVPDPPWTKIQEIIGKVNDAEFLGASAGTVLFNGAACNRAFNFVRTDAGNYWTIRYNFMQRTIHEGASTYGWNYFFKETAIATKHWNYIKDASGNKPYDDADFTDLFEFEN